MGDLRVCSAGGNVFTSACVAGLLTVVSGCATFPENTIGNHPDAVPSNGLDLYLKPVNGEHYRIPEPILLDVVFTNSGSQPVLIPRKPFICLGWRFPRCVRSGKPVSFPDHLIESGPEIVTLSPGESRVFREVVKTSHFPNMRGRVGILEFKAAYNSEYNPRSTQFSLWDGASVSNTYGVEVVQ